LLLLLRLLLLLLLLGIVHQLGDRAMTWLAIVINTAAITLMTEAWFYQGKHTVTSRSDEVTFSTFFELPSALRSICEWQIYYLSDW